MHTIVIKKSILKIFKPVPTDLWNDWINSNGTFTG